MHILRIAPDLNTPEQEQGLPPCPVCGANAYLHSDTVDGFWFGWSVGCPRYCLYDGVHGHDLDTPTEDHLAAHGFITKKEAVSWWMKRAGSAISKKEALKNDKND